jgi:hypothetical protein
MRKKVKHVSEANLYLIQRFQSWEYLINRDSVRYHGRHLKRSVNAHLKKILILTQSDIDNFNKNIEHLAKTYPGVIIISTDFESVQFHGLTNKQMRECSMVKECNFELLETKS